MAFSERSLDDYVDVAQRIADFREKYPEGCLQPANLDEPYHLTTVEAHWCRRCVGERAVKISGNWKTCPRCEGTGLRRDDEPVADVFVVYVAAAYRTPDDPRPGIGVAWEPFPGRTPYTALSEVMNAETSAQGRAIVAALASDSKAGVASREEVRNRRAERDDGLPTNADGSLSRSRTTDAEKDAAGVMTAAQQAEHTRLQPKRAETAGKVTRLPTTPGDDPWAASDALAAAVEQDIWQTPEDKPGTITPQQQRAIMARFGDTSREQRIEAVQSMVGHPVTSTNELSYVEAQKILAAPKGRAK